MTLPAKIRWICAGLPRASIVGARIVVDDRAGPRRGHGLRDQPGASPGAAGRIRADPAAFEGVSGLELRIGPDPGAALRRSARERAD